LLVANDTVTLQANKIILRCSGTNTETGLARLGDIYGEDPPGTILSGTKQVTARGLALATLGDQYVRGNKQDSIRQGISGLTIAGKISALARLGSETIRISQFKQFYIPKSSKVLNLRNKLVTINISNYQLQTPQQYQVGFIKINNKQQLYWLTDQKGKAEIEIPEKQLSYKIHIPEIEILKVNQQLLKFPSSVINSTATDLDVEYFQPPMILDCREQHLQAKQVFTFPSIQSETINYIKSQGNNICIFIHGFNVQFGEFSSFRPSTFLRDWPSENDSCVNGTGFVNWLLYIENNLNLAAGVFTGENYDKFQRLLHVSWSGDVPLLDYLDSEDHADYAGKQLAANLELLISAGIEVNILTHSMGARVAMSALQHLGLQHQEVINKVILCQPALPNNALSNNSHMDQTIKQNSKFTSAYRAAKQFTVLYSNQDQVLGMIFWLANYIGVSKRQLMSREGTKIVSRHLKSELGRDHGSLSTILIDPRIKENLLHAMVLPLVDATPLGRYIQKSDEKDLKRLAADYKVRTALGYSGPELEDRFIQELITEGKLILADVSEWGNGHSYLKSGKANIIKNIYQKWIINNNVGINNFGKIKL